MAPEVMCAQNHTIGVDYFALGVMTYEFMQGKVLIRLIRDHMLEKRGKKLRNTLCQNKYK
jgi:hypothetical protein